MSHSYTTGNTAAYEQLRALVNRLTDEELSRPLTAGWTVSGVLAHLAFWDLRALTLLQHWQQNGVGPSPIDVDVVNEASRKLCLAIPPRAAAQLVLTAAQAIDQEIAQLEPILLNEVETNGKTVRLDRAAHRRMHLEEIEQAFGSSQ